MDANTTLAVAATSGTALTTLTLTAQAKALRAIEDVHLSYHGKGGIAEAVAEVERQVQSAGQHVYSLAVYASRQCETVDEAAKLFRDMCAFAEAKYKEQHDIENLRDALPTWATYKSNILRGITRYELDPVDYRSERQYRIAVDAKRDKDRTRRPREGPPEIKTPDEIGEFLQTTTVRNSLVGPVAELVFHVEALAHGKTQEALKILNATLTKLEPLVDPDKIH